MKKILTKSLKKISYIGLLIIFIAFFAIPSIIFAEGDEHSDQEQITEVTQVETAQTEDTEQTPETLTVSGQEQGFDVENDLQQTGETVTEETIIEEPLVQESLDGETPGEVQEEVLATEIVYSPAISTDKKDYNPGEMVTVFGTRFKPQDAIEISFFKADGELEFSGTIVSDASGNFIFTYTILGSPEYKVTAKSVEGDIGADTIFKDRATAEFETNGPRLTGSQFYEEIMYVDVHRDLTPIGTDDNMIAFCIDLQHYLNDYTGDDFDVYSFIEYNTDNNDPAGKKDTSLTWPLPIEIQALAP